MDAAANFSTAINTALAPAMPAAPAAPAARRASLRRTLARCGDLFGAVSLMLASGGYALYALTCLTGF